MIKWINAKYIIKLGRKVLLLGVICGVIILLVLPVRILSSAVGIVTNKSLLLTSPFKAKIFNVYVKSGDNINVNDIILMLDTAPIQQRLNLLQTKIPDEETLIKIKILRTSLMNSVIRSSTSGVIEFSESLKIGQVVSEGKTLCKVYSPAPHSIQLIIPEDGRKAFLPPAAIVTKDVYNNIYEGEVVYCGNIVYNTEIPHLICEGIFKDKNILPIGSNLNIEATYYRGHLFGLIFAKKPKNAVYRFGR